MVDELTQKEDSTELQPGEQNQPEAEESETEGESETAELERLAIQKDEELADMNARLLELEQVVASKDDEVASLKQTNAELEERVTTGSGSLTKAVASYRAMVVQANPEAVEELISGDTIEAIDESLNKAKTLVSKVRQGLESEISLARIPAGAPERTSPDLSALSAREKIQYAIGGKR